MLQHARASARSLNPLGVFGSQFGIGVTLVFALTAGCASQPPPAQTSPEPAQTHASGQTAAGPAPGTDKASSAPASAAAAAPAATAARQAEAVPLSKVCASMCESMSSKCSADQIKACTLSYCAKYVTDQPACDAATRAAFACAQSGKDFLLCSNVINDNCAKKFLAVQKCGATGVAPVLEAEGIRVPEGWERFEAADARFSILMPKGVATKQQGNAKLWTAKAGAASYEVSHEPAPSEPKFDQRAFLRIANKLLGRCSDKMKLFALIEKPDRSFIHYKTRCPDQSEERGVLYVHGPDYFVVRSHWPGGPNPDVDSFVYSFDRK
jgi:hypothetical protein